MRQKKKTAEKIINSFLAEGYAAFFVGGCVRDMLIGKKPDDFDIATNAAVEEIRAVAERSNWKTMLVGQKFGVVIIIAKGAAYEVVSFRTEAYSEASRSPVAVAPVATIEEDLGRRDLTINALAMSIDGSIIDPYGGTLDLEKKIIRAVGSAEERFAEDALRMFRAVRFAATFNFLIEPATFAAIAKNLGRVTTLSSDRVAIELNKIILAPYPLTGLELLRQSSLAFQHCRVRANQKEVLSPVLPELQFLPPESSGELAFLAQLPPDVPLRVTAFLSLLAKNAPLDAATVLLRLKVKKKHSKIILWLLKNFPQIPSDITPWLNSLAQDFSDRQQLRYHLFYLTELWRANAKCMPAGNKIKKINILTKAINQTLKTVPFFTRQLAISGQDIAAQLGANANVKKFQLNALLKIQKGQLQNTPAALREELRQYPLDNVNPQ